MAALTTEVVDLQTSNAALTAEIEALKTKPDGEPQIKWGCYYFGGDQTKLYCIACYETARKKHPTIRLDSNRRQCTVCQRVFGAG
jgi:hypothetical protein